MLLYGREAARLLGRVMPLLLGGKRNSLEGYGHGDPHPLETTYTLVGPVYVFTVSA